MPEWAPGVLGKLLTEIEVTGQAHFRAGLLKIAAAVEAKTKTELGRSSHTRGTPSPASRGGPPALVSGTGRRSIGHQYMAGVDPQVRIGTIAGVYPPSGKTPSSQYLKYQETLSRFNHPFLVPSFRAVIKDESVTLWLEAFRAWPKI